MGTESAFWWSGERCREEAPSTVEILNCGDVVLRRRACNRCDVVFWICPRCDRGQRYCSLLCRNQARRQQRRFANRRHQQSPEGRQDHRDRQREYRRRSRIKARVTDQGSAVVAFPGKIPAWDTRLVRIATQVGFTAVSVSPRSPSWSLDPFLCCAWCGCRGRFVDLSLRPAIKGL